MKKAIKILGTVLCVVVLFLNLSINGKNEVGDTSLSVLLNNADALCYDNESFPMCNTGRCNIYSENCYQVFNPEGDCDPTYL
mgnify:CR=1 FL=1|jgi:hypothetical protein